jgi:hypothetical protein
MSLLTKKINGSLQDGQYMVLLQGAKEVPATETLSERVVINVSVPALNNRMVEISCFEQQLEFIVRDLINTYFPNESLSLVEVIEQLRDKEIPMRVERKTVEDLNTADGSRTYINYYFRTAPVKPVTQAETSEESGLVFH